MKVKNSSPNKPALRRVLMKDYLNNPAQFELRSGAEQDAPPCPFGNRYQWIGYDRATGEYVRLTKSVFKKLRSLDKSFRKLN